MSREERRNGPVSKLSTVILSFALTLVMTSCKPGTAPLTFNTQHTPSDHFPAFGL